MHRNLVCSAVSLLIALPVVPALAGDINGLTDPVAVQRELMDDLGKGDVQAAMALFTEDAVIDSESGRCATAPCVGKAAIRNDLERYVRDKSRRVTVLDTHVAGDVVVTRFEARSSIIHDAGVDRIILWGIREMRGDKISSSRCCLPDRTDPQTARFLAWDNAHPSVN